TVLWFRDDLRPYLDLSKVDAPLEAKILNILDATTAEEPVKEALTTLTLLAKGRLRDGSKERDFPANSITLNYLIGNHGRVSNATPMIRKLFRELLGLKGDAQFDHIVLRADLSVIS